MDGTCTGEHGIGYGKIEFLNREHGESVSVMRQIKTVMGSDAEDFNFDPMTWRFPEYPLPESYLDLLQWSNGANCVNGEREFGFFSAVDPQHSIRAMLLAYHVPEYMPLAVPLMPGASTPAASAKAGCQVLTDPASRSGGAPFCGASRSVD